MDIKEVRSRIMALPSAGVANLKDSRFTPAYLDNLANQARGAAIRERVRRNNPVHQSWYMTWEPEYSTTFQKTGLDDDALCYVRFKMIPYISINSRLDGINFIGGANNNVLYRQVNDRATFAMNQKDRLLKAKSRMGIVHVLIEDGVCEAWSKINIDSLRIRLIPSDPFDIPTWNPDVDDYPIDVSLMDDMVRWLMQTDLTVITKSFYDRITNGRDETAPPIPQTLT